MKCIVYCNNAMDINIQLQEFRHTAHLRVKDILQVMTLLPIGAEQWLVKYFK